jgi:hypothetical protein
MSELLKYYEEKILHHKTLMEEIIKYVEEHYIDLTQGELKFYEKNIEFHEKSIEFYKACYF